MKRLFISLLLLLTPFALIQGDEKEERGQDSNYVDDKSKIMEEVLGLHEKTKKDVEECRNRRIKNMQNMTWWTRHSNILLPVPESTNYCYVPAKTTRGGGRVSFLGEAVVNIIRGNRDYGQECSLEFIKLLVEHGGDPTKDPKFLSWDHEPHPDTTPVLTALQVSEEEKIVEERENLNTTKNPSHCAKRIYNYFKDLQERKGEGEKMLLECEKGLEEEEAKLDN